MTPDEAHKCSIDEELAELAQQVDADLEALLLELGGADETVRDAQTIAQDGPESAG